MAETKVIERPEHARLRGLESLRRAVQQDGGVPLPENLEDFIRDRKAAVQLGKALFWDMQVGSDGVQRRVRAVISMRRPTIGPRISSIRIS
ncbi:MAG: hypothetical protein ACREYE_04050 [Gammaproteobacteria bacterium]